MKRWIPFIKKPPMVAVIRLNGAIASGGRGNTLNDAGLAPIIERAFRKAKPAAVALVINSPGGSPAQSSLIGARIRRLAEERDIKVYAFVEDVAASGGYWLACAADEIWVDPSSIVGSIGVIYSGFGFHDFIGKHGVERRVHTAGKSKSMLDPFRPENPKDIARLQVWQQQIHDTFIDHVKSRRGARLSDNPDLFTGDVWVGANSIEVGLADGVAHIVPKMKEIFGDKVRFANYGQKRSLFQRIGASLASDALGIAEERALYSRFGL
ncbi:MAG: S49 family peptidase [Rhodobacter sp.]|nr:S49 family peptidase [Rhodobacter sp.]